MEHRGGVLYTVPSIRMFHFFSCSFYCLYVLTAYNHWQIFNGTLALKRDSRTAREAKGENENVHSAPLVGYWDKSIAILERYCWPLLALLSLPLSPCLCILPNSIHYLIVPHLLLLPVTDSSFRFNAPFNFFIVLVFSSSSLSLLFSAKQYGLPVIWLQVYRSALT